MVVMELLANVPDRVSVYEVSPRDGLQNESATVPLSGKLRLIDALVAAGLERIEVTSFVSPKWIPQLADADELVEALTQREYGRTKLSALCPNARGLERAKKAGIREIAVFMSASETHNKKNVNKTIAETLEAFREVVSPALAAGVKVRAYVSTVFGCPYEGDVPAERSVALCKTLQDMGVYQISVSDTIGVGNPVQVQRILGEVLAAIPSEQIAVHFHDTQGTALANCLVALTMGITTIDSSVGGLGGCPYAPGAAGNLATDDLVSMLHGMGIETGIDLDKLVEASRLAAAFVGHDLPSKYLKAHLGKQARARRRAERAQGDPA